MKNKNRLLLTFACVLLIILIFIYPEQSLNSAKSGVELFLFVVFPSLLPFFVVSSIMLKTGIVESLGKKIEPCMRILFGCPGASAYAFILGWISGYPQGVRIVCKMVDDGILSKQGAERTIVYCSATGPLFIVGTIAAGLLKSPQTAIMIMLSHYGGAIMAGQIERLFLPKDRIVSVDQLESNRLPAGNLLGNAMKDGVHSLWIVGGYIVLFSCIIGLMDVSGLLGAIGMLFSPLLKLLGLPADSAKAFIAGIIEITNGCSLTANTNISLEMKACICTMMVSWSGLSIHAQAISYIAGSGLSVKRYLIGKAMHSLCSLIIFVPLSILLKPPIHVFAANEFEMAAKLSLITVIPGIIMILLLVLAGILANKKAALKKAAAGNGYSDLL